MTDPLLDTVPMKSGPQDSQPQLALTLPLPPSPGRGRRGHRPCTRARARWWFDEMRRIVEAGLDFPHPGLR